MQIKTVKLSHIYSQGTINQFQALKDVSLTFNLGEFVAIIGHTGSGKTTLIEHLNGLLRPTFGEVHIDNIKIDPSIKNKKIKNINSIRKKVGIVFQFAEYQLFEETIEKDIIFGPRNMGVPLLVAKDLAKEYIQLVGLPLTYLSRNPFALSGGQKRRIALAGILAMEPDILIFDEPTAGLDPEGISQMYQIFTKLNQAGKTIIVVTHALDQVLTYAKRTILLRNGEVVRDGNTLDILYDEELLKKNHLHPPKLVSLVKELELCGQKIGRVNSIEALVKKIEVKNV